MIEVIKRPSQYAGEPIGECVHVSFVLDGVQYEYDVPKVGQENGKNRYYVVIDDKESNIVWNSDINYWIFTYYYLTPGISTLYYNPTDIEFPIFDTWTYDNGDFELTDLITTPCGYTSEWQAVHHPIKWEVQRKDALVVEKSIDGSGFVSFELTDTPPVALVVGMTVTYYNGTTVISGQVTSISGDRIRINRITPTGVLSGGFIIFNDLYSNYYIETDVRDKALTGTTSIGTIRTIPKADGSATIRVDAWLKTKATYDNEFGYDVPSTGELGMSGRYSLRFRECYNFTKQTYQSEETDAYWVNASKQIRDLYGSNMAEYVSNPYQEVKFLTLFNKPTNFIGFPFSLSYIHSELITDKYVCRIENNTTETVVFTPTLLLPSRRSVCRLMVTNSAQSVRLEYGVMDGSAFDSEGVMIAEQPIKINNSCSRNSLAVSWLNTLGGREHWVFQSAQLHGIETQSGATYQPNIDDLENARGTVFDMEKFAQPTITLSTTCEIEDINGLRSMLYSICVEIYTAQGWINVRPETGSFRLYNTKDVTTDIELTLRLPNINIQSR